MLQKANIYKIRPFYLCFRPSKIGITVEMKEIFFVILQKFLKRLFLLFAKMAYKIFNKKANDFWGMTAWYFHGTLAYVKYIYGI
jgi:hypothetical protein